MKLGIPCIASSKFFLLSFGGLLDAGTFLYTLLQSFYHLFKCCSLYSGYSPKFRNFVFEYPDIFSYFVSPNFNSIFHFRKRYNGVAVQAGKVFDDDAVGFALPDVCHHLLERGTVES